MSQEQLTQEQKALNIISNIKRILRLNRTEKTKQLTLFKKIEQQILKGYGSQTLLIELNLYLERLKKCHTLK